ncbi:unnamed protein product [Symbiodinium microadriaticum]|nr:unnamed protein product [Symbiodinium sp. KB8]CAE7275422.1 unnamed protein product [Symbiodinium microadriaticum]
MGCSHSSGLAEAPTKHTFGDAEPENVAKSALQVRDKVLVECAEPSSMADFDSWKHVMDEYDVKALDSGKSMPINRTAHQHYAIQTRGALQELTADPELLKRLVKKHRMEDDRISACVSHGASSPSPAEAVDAPPSSPVSRKPTIVSLG